MNGEIVASDSNSLENAENKVSPTKKRRNKKTVLKPIRNSSAFILYSKDIRKTLAAEPDRPANPNDLLVKIAQLWKTLDASERDIYVEKAKEDKIRYLKELKEFYEKFPCEQTGNKTKNNHIKRPCTPYALFLASNKQMMKKSDPKLRMADIVKLTAQKWKELSQEEKEVYKDQAKADKQEKADQYLKFALNKVTKVKSHKFNMKKRNRKIEKMNHALLKLEKGKETSDEYNMNSSIDKPKRNIDGHIYDESFEDDDDTELELKPQKKVCISKESREDNSD